MQGGFTVHLERDENSWGTGQLKASALGFETLESCLMGTHLRTPGKRASINIRRHWSRSDVRPLGSSDLF